MMNRIAIAAVMLGGCVDRDPVLSATSSAETVADYGDDGDCSTAVVRGLSQQIVEEAACETPDAFVAFDGAPGITLASDAVLPYLAQPARDALVHAAAEAPLVVTSALRTIAQQYLLVRWFERGACGITAVAPVGHSNHEGGRAVDLDNWDVRTGVMAAHNWSHDVPGDDVHFDHLPTADDRGRDVLAFQVLWNVNHPDDAIAEDADYGAETEARLAAAPAAGFARGPACITPGDDSGTTAYARRVVTPRPELTDVEAGIGCAAGRGDVSLLVALPLLGRRRRRSRCT